MVSLKTNMRTAVRAPKAPKSANGSLSSRVAIMSYVQLANLMIYVVAVILIIATLLDRDPLALVGALGALTAVLMLVGILIAHFSC